MAAASTLNSATACSAISRSTSSRSSVEAMVCETRCMVPSSVILRCKPRIGPAVEARVLDANG